MNAASNPAGDHRHIQGRTLNFRELLQAHVIEIPLIQRDYAQGRESARRVRERFLDLIFTALRHGRELGMDFIYGKEVRGSAAGPVVFLPIDGQQRLTTLFLLHWLIAHREGKIDDFKALLTAGGTRTRFRFLVRPSSERFFEALAGLDKPPESFQEKAIAGEKWFFRGWLGDPSVKGALTMLEAIAAKYREIEGGGIYERLDRIRMEVLSLGGGISADDIYLKMNSRGKELTGFEKFKAWLIDRHPDLVWRRGGKDWKLLLDQDWLELFWERQPKDGKIAANVSSAFFRTFVALAIHGRLAREDGPVIDPGPWFAIDDEFREKLWADLFDEDCLKGVFEALHLLSLRPSSGDGERGIARVYGEIESAGIAKFTEAEDCFFDKPSRPVTLRDRAWLHAIVLYLARGGEVGWLRISRNLIENSAAESANFQEIIRGLGSLAAVVCSPAPLEKLRVLDVRGQFAASALLEQLSHEQVKAARMLDEADGGAWTPAIRASEEHVLLRGQIEILLEGDPDAGKFQRRWGIFQELTGPPGERLASRNKKLLRAVLARCGDIRLGGYQESIELPKISRAGWGATLASRSKDGNRRLLREAFARVLDEVPPVAGDGRDIDETLEEIPGRGVRPGEAWMRNLIDAGDALLDHSMTWKVQNYRGNGIFLYVGTNSNEGDSWIGGFFEVRNRLIKRLRDHGWIFEEERQAPWRIIGGYGFELFRGHEIQLEKKLAAGYGRCRFGYRGIRLESGDGKGEAGEIAYLAGEGALERMLEMLETEAGRLGIGALLPAGAELS